jgi:hypothetical protein
MRTDLFSFLRSMSKSHPPTFALVGTQDKIGLVPQVLLVATLVNAWGGEVRAGA